MPVATEAEFEYKLAETDAYLQLMIEQVKVNNKENVLYIHQSTYLLEKF